MKLTTEDVSSRTGLSMSSVYRLMASGDIPYTRPGYRAEFAEEDIDAFVKKREGYGDTVPSTLIYQSNHITCLFTMLNNFELSHNDDGRYYPLFKLNSILRSHFSAVLKARSEGKSTTFNGSKINHVLVDLRKQAEKAESDRENLLFIAGEIQRIFTESYGVQDRIFEYTQMLIDIVININEQPVPAVEIYMPNGDE